jgi:putative ABC transport system ATP-binding protein
MDALTSDALAPSNGAPTRAPELIALRGVEKVYGTGPAAYTALRGVDLDIGAGEMVAIVGPSGSGKTTVLNVLTGIDRPTAGSVTVAGTRLDQLREEALARWRADHVGIVFQFFQLVPTLNALENVVLALDLARRSRRRERRQLAREHLARVGLADKERHLPSELSGGEQQRVAIARALVREPSLVVADEPTGNLDSAAAESVLELLTAVNAAGTTIVFVTHDAEPARRAGRRIAIRDGRVEEGP